MDCSDLSLEPRHIDHDHFTRFRKQLGATQHQAHPRGTQVGEVVVGEPNQHGGDVVGNRIGVVEHSIADRFGRLEDAATVFDIWMLKMDTGVEELLPEMDAIRKADASVEDLRSEMMALHKSVSRVVLDCGPAATAGILHLH